MNRVKKLAALLLAAGTIAGLQSCYYDKFDEIHPDVAGGGGCDTANVTFSASVQPVFQTYCLGCHSGSAASAGYDLSTHAGAKKSVDNQRLLGSIKHQAGFSAMPKGSTSPIDECSIKKIEIWVQQGAPNN